MPYSLRRTLSIIFQAPLFFVLTAALYAGGQPELYSQVDQLIAEKNYNEAQKKLTAILNEDPEQFDRVQQRLSLITKKEQDINVLQQKIWDLAAKDDTQGMYSALNQLMQLNPYPNKDQQTQIASLQLTIGVKENAKKLDALMTSALAQVEAGQDWAAVQTYLSGLDIGKEIFDTIGYGNIAESQVSAATKAIRGESQSFIDMKPALTSAVAAKDTAFGGGAESAILTASHSLNDLLLSVSRIRNTIAGTSRTLQTMRSALAKQRPDLSDVYYLQTIHILLAGRPGQKAREGVLGALDRYWLSVVSKYEGQTGSILDATFKHALSLFDQSSWGAATNAFSSAVVYSQLAAETASLWESRMYVGSDLAVTPLDSGDITAQLSDLLHFSATEEASRLYVELTPVIVSTLQSLDVPKGASLQQLQETRDSLSSRLAGFQTSRQKVETALEGFNDFQKAGIPVQGELGPISGIENRIDARIASAQSTDAVLAARIADLRIAELTQQVDPEQTRIEQAASFINGVPEQPGTAGSIVDRLPSKGTPLLADARTNLQKLQSDASGLDSQLRAEKSFVLATAQMKSELGKSTDLQDLISQLLQRISSLADTANKQMAQANLYRQQALTFLDEGDRALQANNYDLAAARVGQATDASVESQSYETDKAFAAEIDQRAQSLSTRIRNARTSIVVSEVRRLINTGKQAYGSQDYQTANQTLLNARATWATVYTEPDPEVEYWIGIVQAALKVKTGREVSDTNPLYGDMQTRLNYAHQAFNAGATFLASGDKVDALKKFGEAQNQLFGVLTYFPLNEDANVLTLKIEQKESPDDFNRKFQGMISDAASKLAKDPEGAYNDLQNLAVIDPNNARLNNLLLQAKYALKLEQPPPDPQKIRQSTAQYAAAKKIYDSNDTANFSLAVTYLNNALELNPNNTAAANLKDTISSRIGGTARYTLSTDDMRKLQQAVLLFQQQDDVRAYDIVKELWKVSANQNYQELKDLNTQLKARLGL